MTHRIRTRSMAPGDLVLESPINKGISQYLKSLGFEVSVFSYHKRLPPGAKGWFDIAAVGRGVALLIQTKRGEGGEVSEDQTRVMDAWYQIGKPLFIIVPTSVQDVENVLIREGVIGGGA